MSNKRFEVISVPDPVSVEVPLLINIENETSPPAAPQFPSALSKPEEKTLNHTRSRFFSTYYRRKPVDERRRASTFVDSCIERESTTHSASSLNNLSENTKSSLIPHSTSLTDTTLISEENDVYATVQSTAYDTNSFRPGNKFLQELRSKRREIISKAKNISIEQRIASYRRKTSRPIVRAQDIFAVHFEVNDDEENPLEFPILEENLFTEETQEKIRNDIYDELNRRQMKMYKKQCRQFLLARTFLFIIVTLHILMAVTVIFAVSDIFNRGKKFNFIFSDENFKSVDSINNTNTE